MDKVEILQGHAIDVLKGLESESVHCCVTSPPYWGLRDYKLEPLVWGGDWGCEHEWSEVAGQRKSTKGNNGSTLASSPNHDINARFDSVYAFCACGAWRGSYGLEPTIDLYVEHTLEIFREARRVLRRDGTLWLNLGDCYATGAGKVGDHPGGGKQGTRWTGQHPGRMKQNGLATNSGAALGPMSQPNRMPQAGLKPKDLVGMPWRIAFALQADGWWLRSDIIWAKPNPMPESVTGRPTRSHEYIFLLTKSAKYFYDAEAIKEPASLGTHERTSWKTPDGWDTSNGDGGHGSIHRAGREKGRKLAPAGSGIKNNGSMDAALAVMPTTRNKRSVWTLGAEPYSEAHFATFPTKLIEPCILAGSPVGGTVLDPFAGSGTVGKVSLELGRHAVLIELSPEYIKLIGKRCNVTYGLGIPTTFNPCPR